MLSSVNFPQKLDIRGRRVTILVNFEIYYFFYLLIVFALAHCNSSTVQVSMRFGFVGVNSVKLRFVTLRDEIWPT